MTIKKIGLSALTAAIISTTAFAAGTLSVDGGIMTASNELLSVVAVDANITTNLTYKNGMTAASATEPGFEIVFPGLTASAGNANLIVLDPDTNDTIATFDRIDGTTKLIFQKEVGATVIRNKTYAITSKDVNTSITNGDLIVHLPIGSTSATAELTLWNNNGNPVPIDTATGTIINTVDQYALTIDTPLSAEINAADEFLSFSNHLGYTADFDTTTDDSFDFTITNLEDVLDFPAITSAILVNAVAVSDVNLSNDVQSIDASNVTGEVVVDNNITYPTFGTLDSNVTVVSTTHTDETTAMQATQFTATAKATFAGGSYTFANGVAAGAWTIYGYNAQIPGASSSAFTDTVVTIVNTQPKDTAAVDAYFTIIDADGNECTLNSTQGFASVAAAKPSSDNKYRLSAMLTDCGSAVSGSAYAIEVTVPTTPTDIYSQAAVLNTSAGRDTKALPVYNNANSY